MLSEGEWAIRGNSSGGSGTTETYTIFTTVWATPEVTATTGTGGWIFQAWVLPAGRARWSASKWHTATASWCRWGGEVALRTSRSIKTRGWSATWTCRRREHCRGCGRSIMRRHGHGWTTWWRLLVCLISASRRTTGRWTVVSIVAVTARPCRRLGVIQSITISVRALARWCWLSRSVCKAAWCWRGFRSRR